MRDPVNDARETLRLAKAEVVDVDAAAGRAHFLGTIRRVGKTGPHQGEFHQALSLSAARHPRGVRLARDGYPPVILRGMNANLSMVRCP
jgi:hypothetical protein